MRLSLNWLKEYVEVDLAPEDLADRLTMLGFEVEGIERPGDKFEKFVIGEVVEVSKHPNADRLSVCRVSVGGEVLQIVCGAPNVSVGQRVVVGLSGAVVPHNQHDPEGKPFQLSQVKVRGIDSYGMICSAYELGLGDDKSGIIVLEEKARWGTPLSTYLGLDDSIFEIGITPNRPDALCHIGIAREVGASLGKRVKLPKVETKKTTGLPKSILTVRIEDPENCPRYTARVIKNILVAPSPRWLVDRLAAVGVRSVNNIVDVTNYVLMECGQPLHAFNYDVLVGYQILVRCAVQGETFTTLDHKSRTLHADTLLICDGEKPIAIAGVMGGENSEISSTTKTVVLESAYFKPQSIRRTSKAFGLSTDASQRFERGADPNGTIWAINRAASLIKQIAGGEVLGGLIDAYPKKIRPRTIRLRTEKVNEILGTTLTQKEIASLLSKIEIHTLPDSNKRVSQRISCEVPTYRPDILGEIDLVEEVARLFGYNNIETKQESIIRFPDHAPEKQFSEGLRDCLIGSGYIESVTNSMQEKSIARIGSDALVEIANPISKDMAALRTGLISSMLGVIRHNLFHGSNDLKLFEIGKVYRQAASTTHESLVNGYLEEDRVILASSGRSQPLSWDQKAKPSDIFDIKGDLESLFAKISLDKFKFIPYSTTDALTDTGLHIEINGTDAGFVGSVSKDLLRMFEIEQDVFVAELRVDALNVNRLSTPRYRSLPRFPAVMRDVAFVLDASTPSDKISSTIREAGGPLLKQVTLFDIYVGEQSGVGKKSCAFALQFLSEERTLTQEEVDRMMQQIIAHVSSALDATLR